MLGSFRFITFSPMEQHGHANKHPRHKAYAPFVKLTAGEGEIYAYPVFSPRTLAHPGKRGLESHRWDGIPPFPQQHRLHNKAQGVLKTGDPERGIQRLPFSSSCNREEPLIRLRLI